MSSKQNRIIIVVASLLLLVAIVVVAFILLGSHPKPAPNTGTVAANQDTPTGNTDSTSGATPNTPSTMVSDSQVTSLIIKKSPSLINSSTGQPVFVVVNTQQPVAGWYIITIRNTETTTSDAKVILQDKGGGNLVIIAGPGTAFSSQYASFPAEVKAALSQ